MIYLWQCTDCNILVEIHRSIADRDVAPREDDQTPCLCSEPKWKRVLTAPTIVGKASYLDGQRKLHSFREAAQLKKEARQSKDHKKKQEISSEIRKLGVKQYE